MPPTCMCEDACMYMFTRVYVHIYIVYMYVFFYFIEHDTHGMSTDIALCRFGVVCLDQAAQRHLYLCGFVCMCECICMDV